MPPMRTGTRTEMAYLLCADQVLTGPAGQRISPGAVLVDAETIVAVGPRDQVATMPAAQSALELAFPGTTILPGLINAHVHLAFNGRADLVDELMNQRDDARLVLAMAGRAHQLLDSGVTTVRDLGDRGALTIQLREAIAADEIPGPRILAATAPLTLPNGHCWFLGGLVDGPEEIRAQIESNAAAGADLIKIMVSGGSITPGGAHMWESQFDTDDLKVAVQAAHRLGLPVAAHAHGLGSIRSAIDARVDTIEHCTWLDGGMTPVHDERTVADLVVAGIAVCTANSNNWRLMASRLGEQRAKDIIGRVRWMNDRGVRMIIGTDAGLSPFTDTAAALEGLADWGLSASEIIEIATTKTAQAIGLPTTGRIAPGYSADIIVAHGDPLDDLTRLRDLHLVMTRGRAHIPATRVALRKDVKT